MRRFLLCSILTTTWLVAAPTAAQPPDFDQAGTRTAELLQTLVRIDTTSPPGNETEVARYLQTVLAEDGIGSDIYALDPTRGNLVARLEGDGSEEPLLLMAHTDVVGVDPAQWSMDPFGGEIRDGYLYGRGASDDKGQLAAMVEVLRLLVAHHVPLARDVVLLAEAGEEGTTEVGIDFMVEQHLSLIHI